MNTTKLIFIIASFFAFGTVYGQSKMKAVETMVNASELPTVLKNYAKTHFPKSEITKVRKTTHPSRKGSVEYDVYLNTNYELSFNEDFGINAVRNMNKQKSELPESVIPAFIRSYVSKNYPDAFITSWTNDNKDFNYMTVLNTGRLLVFNSKKKIIPIKQKGMD